MSRKQLKIGLAAYGTGWDLDAWRLPEATNSGLVDPSVIADLAATAERGKLDYLFAGSSVAAEPDVLSRVFRWDSAVFAGHAAARTEHVGFLVTYNSGFLVTYNSSLSTRIMSPVNSRRSTASAMGVPRSTPSQILPPLPGSSWSEA